MSDDSVSKAVLSAAKVVPHHDEYDPDAGGYVLRLPDGRHWSDFLDEWTDRARTIYPTREEARLALSTMQESAP